MTVMDSVYAASARFDNAVALSNDELRNLVPSIFATSGHESRSERFKPIPTIDAVEALRLEGFQVVGAKQNRVRTEDRKAFTKHLLRFRRLGDDDKYRVGDTVTEIYLRNANDGTSQYELIAGLFRIACMNSLVSQTSTLASVKVRHSGMDVIDRVVSATLEARKVAHASLEAPERWSAVQLDNDQQIEFAKQSLAVRFGLDENGNVKTPIQPQQLLNVRRRSDEGNDLWRVFNRVQENAIVGGLSNSSLRPNGRIRGYTSRKVTAIDAEVRINQGLWQVAESFTV